MKDALVTFAVFHPGFFSHIGITLLGLVEGSYYPGMLAFGLQMLCEIDAVHLQVPLHHLVYPLFCVLTAGSLYVLLPPGPHWGFSKGYLFIDVIWQRVGPQENWKTQRFPNSSHMSHIFSTANLSHEMGPV